MTTWYPLLRHDGRHSLKSANEHVKKARNTALARQDGCPLPWTRKSLLRRCRRTWLGEWRPGACRKSCARYSGILCSTLAESTVFGLVACSRTADPERRSCRRCTAAFGAIRQTRGQEYRQPEACLGHEWLTSVLEFDPSFLVRNTLANPERRWRLCSFR